MTQQTINLGAAANDGAGDTLRSGGLKINDNFSELYDALAAGALTIGTSAIAGGADKGVLFQDGSVLGQDADFAWNKTTNVLTVGGTLAITSGKAFAVTRSLTLAGTDATTMTFPATSTTVAGLSIANGFTAAQTITLPGAGKALTLTRGASGISDSCLDLHISTAGGKSIRFFDDSYSTTENVAYVSGAGAWYSRVEMVISGNFSGSTILQPVNGIPNDGFMVGVYGDIIGPMYFSRPGDTAFNITSRHFECVSNWPTGLFQTPNYVYEFSVKQRGVHAWGVSNNPREWDTFLRRGSSAAHLAQGDIDAFAPVSQHFSVQNVVAPTSLGTTATCAAGTAVLSFGQIIPPTVFVGQTITNSTTPGSISGGTTVLSIAAGRASLTMSANAISGGVGLGDTIVFSSVNVAGADRYIDGSRGTGSGVGGALTFRIADAGSTGSAQNAHVQKLSIDSSNAIFATNVLALHAGVLGWESGSIMYGATDGVILMSNSATTGFTQLTFGPDAATTSAVTIQGQSVLAGTSNVAGGGLTISAGQGTGTGASGNILFKTAPASTTGSTQNALATTLSVLAADGTASLGVVNIGRGGATTQQLTFTPNSGNACGFGMSNGGFALTFFVGSSPTIAFSNGANLTSTALMSWTNNATNPNTTTDLGIGRNAAGVGEVTNGSANTYRDLKMRDLFLVPSASLAPPSNGDLRIEATSNTSLTFKYKGSDGTVRSNVLTLA